MISKIISVLTVVGKNYKQANKEPLKWLAFLAASITLPAVLEIKVATVDGLNQSEARSKKYADKIYDDVKKNHDIIIDKLDKMHDQIKILDDRVYQQARGIK